LCRFTVETDETCLNDFDLTSLLRRAFAFLAGLITDPGAAVGVLVFQLSINELDRVASDYRIEKDGLGRTGNTGSVGPDFLMRNNSRRFVETPEQYLARLKTLGASEDKHNQWALPNRACRQSQCPRYPHSPRGGQTTWSTGCDGTA
jgi:hypothetical protein